MKIFFSLVCVSLVLLVRSASAVEADDMFSYLTNTPPRMPDGYPALSEESSAAFSRHLLERGTTLRVERERVAILVDAPLWSALADTIATYTNDVMNRFPVDLIVCTNQSWRSQSHTNVRQFLQELYTNQHISGAVLVGFFPYMIWRTNDMRYPVTINYEDLDGGFRDFDGDGDYEEHIWAGNGLEIWVSLVRPYQTTDSSVSYTTAVISQLQNYFNKCHRYYSNQLVYDKRAFIYVNEPWWWCFNSVQSSSELIYGEEKTDLIGGRHPDGSVVYGNGHEFLVERAASCELLNIWCHSAGYGHTFDQGPYLAVWSKDLAAKNGANGIITILWSCYGSDYGNLPWGDPTGCLGQRYAMEANGLASVGVAKSGYTFGMEQTIEGLANGLYLGQSFLETLNWQYEFSSGFNQDFNFSTNTHVFGQTLIGNPFVYATSAQNMSGPPASVSGSVVWQDGSPVSNAIITVWQSGEIRTMTASGPNGSFFANYLSEGDYTVEAASPTTSRSVSETISLSGAEAFSNCVITLPLCHELNSNWFYKPNITSQSQMPADWNTLNCDLSEWGACHLPLTRYDGGTVTNFGPYVYIRKKFSVTDNGEKVWLNVSADNGISVYVNGTKLSVSPSLGAWNLTRSNLDYWNYRINITAYTSPGENYIVIVGQDAWGGNFINASLYTEGVVARLSLSRNEITLIEPFVSSAFDVINAGTGSFSYSIDHAQSSSWLFLDKTNGIVCYPDPDTVTLSVDRSGLADGYYHDTLQIDAGNAGYASIPVTMVVGLLPVTNRVSAEWCTNTLSACNPNGCWLYAYATRPDRLPPYMLLPRYQGLGSQEGWLPGYAQCGWFITNDIFSPMIAYDYYSHNPDDTAIQIHTATNGCASSIGWRAPRFGIVSEIHAVWKSKGDTTNAVSVFIDHVRGDQIIETLYSFTNWYSHSYWDLETINLTTPVDVEKDDILYLSFVRRDEIGQKGTLLFGTRWGGSHEYRIVFLPVPEPVAFSWLAAWFALACLVRKKYWR